MVCIFSGFQDVFDSGYTMMGMLMIAVSVLMFLGALRMFLIASKLRKAERTLQVCMMFTCAAFI